MASGGDIIVKLEMDDSGYKVSVANAGRLMRELKTNFESTARSVRTLEEHSQSMGRKFRDLTLVLGNLRFVAMDINDVFLRLPMSMLKTSGELEKMQELMIGLSKQSSRAKAELEGMQDFNFVVGMSKNAPFEIKALSDSFVKLKTAGLDPTNGSMKALVDSVARFGGDSESLKRASVAIQQMSGKGVISMEELRQQLGEAVPTAMKAMADGMGITMAELTKLVSSGSVVAGGALEKMFLRMQIENDGAAANLMKTWVGMTARLKTEWDLTSKYIVDNGFGDAAKESVAALTEMLQSDEFRSFAKDFGEGLRDVTRGTVDIAKGMMSAREEIGTLVKAFLAYKLVTAVIAPASQAVSNGFTSFVRSSKAATATLVANAELERQYFLQAAANQKYATQAKQTALAEQLRIQALELESVRVRNAAIILEEERMQAKLRALKIQEAQFNANNIGEQQRLIRYIDLLNVKNGELSARQRDLSQVIPETTRHLGLATGQATHAAEELGRLAAAGPVATTAMGTLKGALSALGTGFMSLVGGPIGLLVIAIGTIAYAWNAVKERAREAEEAQKRAASRQSVEGDVEKLDRKVAEAKFAAEQIAKNAGKKKYYGANGLERQATIQDINERDRAIAEANARVIQATELRERAVSSIQESEAGRRAQNELGDFNRRLSLMDDERAQVLAVERQKLADYEGNASEAEKKTKEYEAGRQKIIRDQALTLISEYDKKIAITRKKESELLAEANSATNEYEKMAKRRALAVVTEQAKALTESRNSAQRALDSKNDLGGGKAKKPAAPKPLTAAEKEMHRLSELVATRQSQLDSMVESDDSKIDLVAASWAKLNQQLANNDFGQLTEDQRTRIIQGTLLSAKLLQDQKSYGKDAKEAQKEAEQAARDAKVTADYIAGIRPAYDEAVSMLLNPLGGAKTGSKEASAIKWIERNQDKIRAYAEGQKTTVQSVTDEIRKMTNMEDMARTFSEFEKDTRQLNLGMVTDTRESAKARAAAEDERHAREMENLITSAKAHGQSNSDIERMQIIMNENMISRAKKLALDFQSPVEKLVKGWENATKNMDEASGNWASSTMGFFTDLVTKGKADFGSLVTSILQDIARIQMQKLMAPVVNAGSDMLTTFLGGMFGSAAPAALPSMGAPIPDFNFLQPTYSANGNIMSEFGPLPLKKYATGGIAKSPQLSIFGEGSMNEAYVPLPDGRTIPVTMKGTGGGIESVQVNIVNQSGQPMAAAQKDVRGSFDGKRMVLDIVMEAVSQPGAFRDNFKGALVR